jgi:hypothetical protein
MLQIFRHFVEISCFFSLERGLDNMFKAKNLKREKMEAEDYSSSFDVDLSGKRMKSFGESRLAGTRKRKMSDVDDDQAFPPRSFMDPDVDLEDMRPLTKRVSLDGDLVLRINEDQMDCDDDDDCRQPETSMGGGWFARSQSELDFQHQYSEINRVLFTCHQSRENRDKQKQ